jgi:hypothetical protein
MANVASVGMFGLSFIIWIANSFMDSRIAKNSVSVCSGLFSGKSLISSQIRIFRSNRFNFKTFSLQNYGSIPIRHFKTRKILATVPIVWISSFVGSSSDSSFLSTTPMIFLPHLRHLST